MEHPIQLLNGKIVSRFSIERRFVPFGKFRICPSDFPAHRLNVETGHYEVYMQSVLCVHIYVDTIHGLSSGDGSIENPFDSMESVYANGNKWNHLHAYFPCVRHLLHVRGSIQYDTSYNFCVTNWTDSDDGELWNLIPSVYYGSFHMYLGEGVFKFCNFQSETSDGEDGTKGADGVDGTTEHRAGNSGEDGTNGGPSSSDCVSFGGGVFYKSNFTYLIGHPGRGGMGGNGGNGLDGDYYGGSPGGSSGLCGKPGGGLIIRFGTTFYFCKFTATIKACFPFVLDKGGGIGGNGGNGGELKEYGYYISGGNGGYGFLRGGNGGNGGKGLNDATGLYPFSVGGAGATAGSAGFIKNGYTTNIRRKFINNLLSFQSLTSFNSEIDLRFVYDDISSVTLIGGRGGNGGNGGNTVSSYRASSSGGNGGKGGGIYLPDEDMGMIFDLSSVYFYNSDVRFSASGSLEIIASAGNGGNGGDSGASVCGSSASSNTWGGKGGDRGDISLSSANSKIPFGTNGLVSAYFNHSTLHTDLDNFKVKIKATFGKSGDAGTPGESQNRHDSLGGNSDDSSNKYVYLPNGLGNHPLLIVGDSIDSVISGTKPDFGIDFFDIPSVSGKSSFGNTYPQIPVVVDNPDGMFYKLPGSNYSNLTVEGDFELEE